VSTPSCMIQQITCSSTIRTHNRADIGSMGSNLLPLMHDVVFYRVTGTQSEFWIHMDVLFTLISIEPRQNAGAAYMGVGGGLTCGLAVCWMLFVKVTGSTIRLYQRLRARPLNVHRPCRAISSYCRMKPQIKQEQTPLFANSSKIKTVVF